MDGQCLLISLEWRVEGVNAGVGEKALEGRLVDDEKQGLVDLTIQVFITYF